MYFTKLEYTTDSIFLLLDPSSLKFGCRRWLSFFTVRGVDEPGVNTFINPGSFKASYKDKERLIIKTILIQIKALTVELGIDFCIEI